MAPCGLATAGVHFGLATHALLTVFCALCFLGKFGDATAVVDVFRMIQYDLGGVPLGSRRSSLSLYAAANASSLPLEDLARAIVVMKLQEVDFSLLQDVVSGSKLIGGLLLLLPRSFGSGAQEPQGGTAESAPVPASTPLLQALDDVEQLLVGANIPAPVYLAVEDEPLVQMLEAVKREEGEGRPASATNGGHKLVVSAAEGRKLKAPALVTLEAWLYGQPRKDQEEEDKGRGIPKSTVLPTIAIVAPYDTFGVAPGLSKGTLSNGSGAVAVLELLRMFSRLYAHPRSQPPFNLVFGLTAGGPFNFEGTRQWLSLIGPRTLDNLELALCLHSLGGRSASEGEQGRRHRLFLHSSKPLKNPRISQLLQELESAAELVGDASVGLVHKKINISDARVPWEHEIFSRQKVLAATVSSLDRAPSRNFERTGGVADVRSSVDDGAVLATVRTVGQTIAAYMYGFQGGSNIAEATESSRGDAEGNAGDREAGATAEGNEQEDPTTSSSSSRGPKRRDARGAGVEAVEFFPSGSSMAPSRAFVAHWLDFLAEAPRVAPFLGPNAPLISALEDELSRWAHKVEQRHSTLGALFTIYSGDSALLHIYEVASVSLDLVLLPLVLFYLALLYVLLHIGTKGLDDFISSFRSSPAKKAKVQ